MATRHKEPTCEVPGATMEKARIGFRLIVFNMPRSLRALIAPTIKDVQAALGDSTNFDVDRREKSKPVVAAPKKARW